MWQIWNGHIFALCTDTIMHLLVKFYLWYMVEWESHIEAELFLSQTSQAGRYTRSLCGLWMWCLCVAPMRTSTPSWRRKKIFCFSTVFWTTKHVCWQTVHILTLDRLLLQSVLQKTESHRKNSCKLLASNSYIQPELSEKKNTVTHLCMEHLWKKHHIFTQ